jgi:hypothetical protein
VKLWARGEVAEEGEICLPPEPLMKMLKAFDRYYLENQITFNVDKTTNQASLSSPRFYRASIQGMPTENFPKLVTFDSYHNQVAVDGETFLSALKLLTDLEQAGEGVWLSCRNSQLEMSGGDGQIVLSDMRLCDGKQVEFVGFGLSAEAVNLLISVLPDDCEELSICTDADGQHIYFDTRAMLGEQIFLSTQLLPYKR